MSIKLNVRGLTRSVAIFIFISIMIVHMKQSLCNVMKYLYKIPNTMGSSQQRVIIVLHIDIYVWLNECCSINMSWSIKIVVMISAAFIRALRQHWIGDWQHDFPLIGCGPDHFEKKKKVNIMAADALNSLSLAWTGSFRKKKTRSISWLLMPWLLASPSYQQLCYWLRMLGRFRASMGKH